MPGSNIATDALRMQLALEVVGGAEALAQLQGLDAQATRINAKALKFQEDIALQRMEVEGKYDPEIQRNLEIEKAIKLTDRLNLSLKTQDAILADIQDKYERATAGPPPQLQGPEFNESARRVVKLADDAAKEKLAIEQRYAREVERIRQEEMTNYERFITKVRALRKDLDSKNVSKDDALIIYGKYKAEYQAAQEHDKNMLKLKQDAAAKEAAIDAARLAKRAQNARVDRMAINLEISQRRQAAQDSVVEANQRRAQAFYARQAELDKEANAARQQAINYILGLTDLVVYLFCLLFAEPIDFYNTAIAPIRLVFCN
jgi:hypothetical protein